MIFCVFFLYVCYYSSPFGEEKCLNLQHFADYWWEIRSIWYIVGIRWKLKLKIFYTYQSNNEQLNTMKDRQAFYFRYSIPNFILGTYHRVMNQNVREKWRVTAVLPMFDFYHCKQWFPTFPLFRKLFESLLWCFFVCK